MRVIPDDAILTRKELASLIGCKERAIGREITAGRLRAFRRLNRLWFHGTDIKHWLLSCEDHRGVEDDTPDSED